MQCGQGKPFRVTSSNPKMGGAAVPSYQKGGMVTKSQTPTKVEIEIEEYRPGMGPPPIDIDQLSALPPGQRRKYEMKAEKETRKDYPPTKGKQMPPPKK